MLLLLHETSQGTFSHVFDRDSTDLDDIEKDIGDYSSKGKRNYDVDDNGISNDYLVFPTEEMQFYVILCVSFSKILSISSFINNKR